LFFGCALACNSFGPGASAQSERTGMGCAIGTGCFTRGIHGQAHGGFKRFAAEKSIGQVKHIWDQQIIRTETRFPDFQCRITIGYDSNQLSDQVK